MKVRELVKRFGLTVAAGGAGLDREINGGHCGDMLSEVMANAPSGCVWLTIQGHQNIVAVAVLREMAAIILTGGSVPDTETRDRANYEKIPILMTPALTYDLAGRLFADGIVNEGTPGNPAGATTRTAG